MADNRASGSALSQTPAEMRVRAERVLVWTNMQLPNGAPPPDELLRALARDVVALTKELERVAGVSGSPDETLLAAAIDKLAVAGRNEWIDKIVLTGDEARALLAGVGEHRPDQPQTTLGGALGQTPPESRGGDA